MNNDTSRKVTKKPPKSGAFYSSPLMAFMAGSHPASAD